MMRVSLGPKERRSVHQCTKAARRPGFPFWPTRFPTSEAYPAIAGRTLRTRLGWVATEVEPHDTLMSTPAVRLRWPFRGSLQDHTLVGGRSVPRPKKYLTEEERREAIRQRHASTSTPIAWPSRRGRRSAIGRGVRPSSRGRRRPRQQREDPRAGSPGGDGVGAGASHATELVRVRRATVSTSLNTTAQGAESSTSVPHQGH